MNAPQLAPLVGYHGQFLVPALILAGLFAVRYLVLASLAFAGWYGLDGMRARPGKLQSARPSRGQITREIGWSALTVLVFGTVAGLLSASGLVAGTRLYGEIAAFGWAYFWLSIPLLLALLAFQTLSTAVNVYGHSGYELYPRGWASHPLGRWLNTSVAHNAHHATGRHNYGLYFLIWNRLLGTIDPGYAAQYDRLRGPHPRESLLAEMGRWGKAVKDSGIKPD